MHAAKTSVMVLVAGMLAGWSGLATSKPPDLQEKSGARWGAADLSGARSNPCARALFVRLLAASATHRGLPGAETPPDRERLPGGRALSP